MVKKIKKSYEITSFLLFGNEKKCEKTIDKIVDMKTKKKMKCFLVKMFIFASG